MHISHDWWYSNWKMVLPILFEVGIRTLRERNVTRNQEHLVKMGFAKETISTTATKSRSQWTEDEDTTLYDSLDQTSSSVNIWGQELSRSLFKKASDIIGRTEVACYHRWRKIRSNFGVNTGDAIARIALSLSDQNIPQNHMIKNFLNSRCKFIINLEFLNDMNWDCFGLPIFLFIV